jgi:hypothetical protein
MVFKFRHPDMQVAAEPTSLQYAAEDYNALNCTKTGTVCRLLGNPPKSHE